MRGNSCTEPQPPKLLWRFTTWVLQSASTKPPEHSEKREYCGQPPETCFHSELSETMKRRCPEQFKIHEPTPSCCDSIALLLKLAEYIPAATSKQQGAHIPHAPISPHRNQTSATLQPEGAQLSRGDDSVRGAPRRCRGTSAVQRFDRACRFVEKQV